MLATPTGADDHRSLGNRQACAFKEVFADALGPNGLVTDTRQNEHQADETPTTRQTPRQTPMSRRASRTSRTR